MMQTKNLWGECQHCSGAMEFAADAVGTTAECPHCGQPTELMLALPPEAAPPARTKAVIFTIVAIVILVGGLVGAVLVLKRAERLTARQREATVIVPPQNPPAPAEPFSQLGFSISPVTVEKSQSGSLVHAVGKIRNTTSRQRFGVRIELELLDASGSKIGSATDYQAMLEPQAEWRFRALVVDRKATSARVVAIKEDK